MHMQAYRQCLSLHNDRPSLQAKLGQTDRQPQAAAKAPSWTPTEIFKCGRETLPKHSIGRTGELVCDSEPSEPLKSGCQHSWTRVVAVSRSSAGSESR